MVSIFIYLRYNLLFYINPQFYGYSAISKALLQNLRLKCVYESKLNCISTEGNAVLAGFGFDTVNIYENLAVSFSFLLNIRKITSVEPEKTVNL